MPRNCLVEGCPHPVSKEGDPDVEGIACAYHALMVMEREDREHRAVARRARETYPIITPRGTVKMRIIQKER